MESQSSSSTHPQDLIRALDVFRLEGSLTDVTLILEKRQFDLHKIVLAACSEYFRVMFTGDMIEKTKSIIELDGVSAEGFATLVDYMYTSKLLLDGGNVLDVLATANYLQLNPVVTLCKTYLECNMTEDSCFDILKMTDACGLEDLRKPALEFICFRMTSPKVQNGLLRIAPLHMLDLVQSDFRMDCGEAVFVKVVISWFLNGDSRT